MPDRIELDSVARELAEEDAFPAMTLYMGAGGKKIRNQRECWHCGQLGTSRRIARSSRPREWRSLGLRHTRSQWCSKQQLE
jgi:hypothetical protein